MYSKYSIEIISNNGLIFFQRGVWRYKVENRADSHQGLHIQVTSFSNPLNDVNVRVWTSQEVEGPVQGSSYSAPVIIYGEVKVSIHF